MAHRPIFRPDPLQPPQLAGKEAFSRLTGAPEWADDDGGYLAELASKLASPADPDANELALDFLLHQTVEQACQETGASGAAIALARGGEVIVHATLGETAPDLGVRLSTRSGLSGLCYQSCQLQVCDDTETDPRVDAAACRQLAIRSIVVLPLLDPESGDRLGVFELYASQPQAFQARQVQALQILCRRIAENIRHAGAAKSPSTAPLAETPAPTGISVEEIRAAFPTATASSPEQHELPSLTPRIREVPPEAPASRGSFLQPFGPARRRDYWTGFLTLVVLALSLLLGWMVGRRAGWHDAQQAAAPPAPRPAMQPAKEAPTQAPQPNRPAPQPARRATVPGITQAVARSVTRAPVTKSSLTQSQSTTGSQESSPGDLVVYEKGKVIFRMPPAGREPGSTTQSAQSAANAGLTVSPSDAAATPAPATLSAEAANAFLIQRVEPQYPDVAKQQNIQGPVVLDVLVGSDGLVREAKVISGDPQLAPAAVAAVRQWRFRPYGPQGQPVNFLTRVTVNFALP